MTDFRGASLPADADVRPGTPVVSYGFSFHGDGGALFRIYAICLLKVLVTLGVYYFWLKARVRGYIYSQTELAGERFAFHGTGWELLKGWVKAMVLLVVVLALLVFAQWAAGPDAAATVGRVVTAALAIVVAPVVIVGSRRYRLSRTSWRGIRFVFRGRVNDLMRQLLVDGLLTAITFGFYYPLLLNNLREFIVTSSAYGNIPFEYDGEGSELWRIYFFGFVFGLLTLGVY